MRKLESISAAEKTVTLKLVKAEILLGRSKSGLWGKLIRLVTGNYWNHVLHTRRTGL